MLAAVTPGHDFGNQIEIVSGLKADDQVIINPPDSIVSPDRKSALFRQHCQGISSETRSKVDLG